MARRTIDKRALIEKLPRIKYVPDARRDQDRFDHVSLAGTLLMLAEITHESEYALCRSLAEHLLGAVPEPDDAAVEDE
jgi:hypothetical protein